MTYRKHHRYLTMVGLVILMLALPLLGTACRAPDAPASAPAQRLAATMVPNRDLDIFILIKQASPTKVPLSLVGAQADVTVESLALWGVARDDDKFTIAGALTFASASDASRIHSQIPAEAEVWTKLSDRNIYFVQGDGGPGQSLKSLISNNNMKRYDDKRALEEVALMPDGGSTRFAAIGVVRPNRALINILKQHSDSATAERIDTIFTWAKPEVVTFGLYAPQQIDIIDILQRLPSNTIWDADFGLTVSVKSTFPGLVFGPVASKALESAGYTRATLGNLTVFKGSFNIGRTIPVLLNVDGNRVFITVSGKESYAEALMSGIRR
ncbi:MAG: hypothetical protein Q8O16_03070 [Dehalococcoidia bacterium]|nr:hypothetical protein [Dehalococcoidia bacterium]